MKVLSPEEIAQAQEIINKCSSGIYELTTLYGVEWAYVKSPTSFGRKFKQTVAAGYLKRIKYSDCKTDNHVTYEIFT